MPASVSNPTDVVNLSLQRIGYTLRVGSLYDGSKAASQALTIYSQTRDDTMRDGDWDFIERNVSLTLLKQAPPNGYFPPTSWNPTTYPPMPWLFSYTYPTDCLKVRAVKPQPLFMFNPDPQPYLFAVLNDQGYTPPRRVICTNVADAVLTYAGQVTDPAQWPADYVEAFAAELGVRLKRGLKDTNVDQVDMTDVARSSSSAMAEQG